MWLCVVFYPDTESDHIVCTLRVHQQSRMPRPVLGMVEPMVFMRIHPKPRCAMPQTDVTVDHIIGSVQAQPWTPLLGIQSRGFDPDPPCVLSYAGAHRE